jgi:hypothetical protein
MEIGLIDVDSHNFPNLALMKISAYHKSIGDSVEWINYFNDYDIVYISKVFKFSILDPTHINAKKIIIGGTGFNNKIELPKEIESCNPDYTIYPQYEFSLQLFSRGCIRKCKFCVVSEKEGKIKSVIPMLLNPNGKYVEVLDNNFFANPNWEEALNILLNYKQPLNFHGVDIRILTNKQAALLNNLKHHKQIKIAWDNPKQDLSKKIKEITKYLKPYKIMCYVLIGFNSTPKQDLFRVEKLRELKIDPFVMPFNKTDEYQRNFARWVNHKAIFNTVEFKNYNG